MSKSSVRPRGRSKGRWKDIQKSSYGGYPFGWMWSTPKIAAKLNFATKMLRYFCINTESETTSEWNWK